MKPPFAPIFFLATGAWVGVLVFCLVALRIWERRAGRAEAWRAAHLLLPLADVIGVWAGATAGAALFFGRRGIGFAWAACMTLLALMFSLALYDRAVLVPYLDRADRRLAHGEAAQKWDEDWRSLSRLATGLRLGTLAMGVAVVTLGTEV